MTQNFADAFDARIRELTEDRKYKLEEVFNLGVELGRCLEKENLSDLRLSYFAEAEEKSDLRKNFGQLLFEPYPKMVSDLIQLFHPIFAP